MLAIIKKVLVARQLLNVKQINLNKCKNDIMCKISHPCKSNETC